MILVAAEVLKALHLSTQTLAVTYVVGSIVTVLRIIATTNVIAEMTIVNRSFPPYET